MEMLKRSRSLETGIVIVRSFFLAFSLLNTYFAFQLRITVDVYKEFGCALAVEGEHF